MRKYRVVSKIGEGPASTVYLLKHEEGRYYAAKVYDQNKCSEKDWENFRQETEQLGRLSHPSILALKQAYVNGQGNLVIVTEYCSGGTLSDYIKASKDSIPEALLLEWTAQLCLALRYIHSKGIIHRDVKSSNIFLTKGGRVKLADFGACREVQAGEMVYSTAGTPSHLPPEMLSSDYGRDAGKGFSFKQDMWALGVVLYEAATKSLPFDGYCLNEIIDKVKSCSFRELPSCYSQNFSSLVEGLLSSNQELRPSAGEVLALGFMRAGIRQMLEIQKVPPIRKLKRSRFQELINLSPQKRSATSKSKQDERSTGVEQAGRKQPTHDNPVTRLFDITEGQAEKDVKLTLEQLLFSKAVIPDRNSSFTTPLKASTENSPSRLNMTFGAHSGSAFPNPRESPHTVPTAFMSARSRTAVSPRDIALNLPIICLRNSN